MEAESRVCNSCCIMMKRAEHPCRSSASRPCRHGSDDNGRARKQRPLWVHLPLTGKEWSVQAATTTLVTQHVFAVVYGATRSHTAHRVIHDFTVLHHVTDPLSKMELPKFMDHC